MIVEFTIPKDAQDLIRLKDQNGLNVYETLEEVRKLEKEAREKIVVPPYKTRPQKHEFIKKETPKEYRDFADALEEWQKYDRNRVKKTQEQSKGIPMLGKIIEDFIKIESGFTEKVPKKYQAKAYTYVYSSAHGSGWYEVYNQLCEFSEIFD